MPLKKKDWGLHKVNGQLIMDFGFERIMMNHIASEMISIIAQEQKMFENQRAYPPCNRLTTECLRGVIRRLEHIVYSKIENGIQLETVQKKQGSSRYFLKITGDSYFDNRLTPWELDAPEEYQEPNYTWKLNELTGIGSYIFKKDKESVTA